MEFKKYKIDGVFSFERPQYNDDRGYLCEFVNFNTVRKETGFDFKCNQSLYSFNQKKNTIRGLHFQQEPFAQDKIVTCIKGSILDVAVDIREDSRTYMKYISVELNENNNMCLVIPKGFAHGYQTLEDDTLVNYLVAGEFSPKNSGGIAYNDGKIGIKWQDFGFDPILSEKDMEY